MEVNINHKQEKLILKNQPSIIPWLGRKAKPQ
jgi:hypothetical protein